MSDLTSLDSLLAYAGRGEQAKPRAPFRWNFDYMAGSSTFERYEAKNGWKIIDPDLSVPREHWTVGITTNKFRFVPRVLSTKVQTKLAHWAIYICPAGKEDEPASYRTFGMNFEDGGTRDELMLEQVWGTKHGWPAQLSQSDLCKLKGFEDIPLYMNLYEFVFTAQILLAHFCSASHTWVSSIMRGGFQSMRGGLIRGENYNLLRGNCQHFSMYLLSYLRKTGAEAGFKKTPYFKLRMLEPLIYSMMKVQEWKLYLQIDEEPLEKFAEHMHLITADYERRDLMNQNVHDFLGTLFSYKRNGYQPNKDEFIDSLKRHMVATYGRDVDKYGDDIAKLVDKVIVEFVSNGTDQHASSKQKHSKQRKNPFSREATPFNENSFLLKLGLDWPGRDT